MFKYVTGNLLESSAYALVNTVNCEGYMGKGIAYQFKLRYPDMDKAYSKECKSGKMKTGKMFVYPAESKLIVNFPTKNKWRAKSKIEYIESGLDDLVQVIKDWNIKSIAIPPLGSGNGGLEWSEVKALIEKKLMRLANDIEIQIYEPSRYYKAVPMQPPKLSTSALVLMRFKPLLNTFDNFHLQKAAYFMNIFSGEDYFHFMGYKYGPYDHSIEIIGGHIKEYEQYYNVNTEEAYRLLLSQKISSSVEDKLNCLWPAIKKAAEFTNTFKRKYDLESASTVCFLIQSKGEQSEKEIIGNFRSWSTHKDEDFTDEEIRDGIKALKKAGIIGINLMNQYYLVDNHKIAKTS